MSDTTTGDPPVDPVPVEEPPAEPQVEFPGEKQAGMSEEDQAKEDALLLSYNESELAWVMSTAPVRYRRYLEITGQLAPEPEPEPEPPSPPVNVDVPAVVQTGAPDAPEYELTCTMGNWTGEPTSYTYAWFLDGVAAGPASAENNYIAMAPDIGMTATCVVTATNEAGSTEAPPSEGVVILDWAAAEPEAPSA